MLHRKHLMNWNFWSTASSIPLLKFLERCRLRNQSAAGRKENLLGKFPFPTGEVDKLIKKFNQNLTDFFVQIQATPCGTKNIRSPHKDSFLNRVFAQFQILALKFLSSTFSRFSNFMDLIFAPWSSCRNSFSAKIHFCWFLVAFFIFLWYTVVLAVLCTLHDHKKKPKQKYENKKQMRKTIFVMVRFPFLFFLLAKICQQKYGWANTQMKD